MLGHVMLCGSKLRFSGFVGSSPPPLYKDLAGLLTGDCDRLLRLVTLKVKSERLQFSLKSICKSDK